MEKLTDLQKLFTEKHVRWEQFCKMVAVDAIPPHRAYAIAYNKPPHVRTNAYSAHVKRLMERDDIKARIAELHQQQRDNEKRAQQELEERTKINREFILLGLRETLERSLERKPVLDNEGKPIGLWMFDGRTANRSLELLGKEIGMFRDQLEVGRPGEFERLSRLTPEELEEEERKAWAELNAAKETEDALARAALPGLVEKEVKSDDA